MALKIITELLVMLTIVSLLFGIVAGSAWFGIFMVKGFLGALA